MSYSNDKYESGEYVWNPQTGECFAYQPFFLWAILFCMIISNFFLVGKLVQDGSDPDATVSCSSFDVLCGPDYSGDCFDVNHQGKHLLLVENSVNYALCQENIANGVFCCNQCMLVTPRLWSTISTIWRASRTTVWSAFTTLTCTPPSSSTALCSARY